MRYSAYRSIFLWCQKTKKWKKHKSGRYPMPSCVVSKVREAYPKKKDEKYKGYQAKSPVFKRRKK